MADFTPLDDSGPAQWLNSKPHKEISYTVMTSQQVIIRASGYAERGDPNDTIRLELRLTGAEWHSKLIAMGEYSNFGRISVTLAACLWLKPGKYLYQCGWTSSLKSIYGTAITENSVGMRYWEPIPSVVDSNFQANLACKGGRLLTSASFEMTRKVLLRATTVSQVAHEGGSQSLWLYAKGENGTYVNQPKSNPESGDSVPLDIEEYLMAKPGEVIRVESVPKNINAAIATHDLRIVGAV